MGLIERPTNDDPRVHRLAQVLARSAWPGDSNRDLRELERHVYALEAQLAGAVDLLAIFVDGEQDCRLDHHGYCQAHGWMDASECHVSRARRLIRGQ
jgi:hypothetical protein